MNEATYREAELAFWSTYGVEPKEHYVELATLGTQIRVQEVGRGDTVVFLHGSPTSGTTFAPLAGQLPGFRCLIPDLPPGGLSPPFEVTKENASILLSHTLVGLLDAMGVDQAHVVASSSGSAFAFKAAAHASGRIDRAVHLGAPGLVDGMPIPGAEKLMLMPGVHRLLGAMTPGPRMQISMMKSIGHAKSIAAGRIPDAYWHWYAALMRDTTTYADQIGMLPALKGPGLDYAPTLKVGDGDLTAQGPTLVVWGSDENLASQDDARKLVDRIPGARLEVFDDAGHLPWLDFPEPVAASVRRFLKGSE
jgi:pimeloyl-ACP methyl ester carboxylesterase